jgi:signal transduction histidine kinase
MRTRRGRHEAARSAGRARFFSAKRPTRVTNAQTRVRSRTRTFLLNVGLAALYVALGRVALMLDPVNGFAALVWPPTGVALAALLLGGLRYLPGIAVGAFAVNVWVGASLLGGLGVAFGNTLEAVVAMHLVSRFNGKRTSFDRLGDVLRFVLFACVIATTISATIGTLSLWLSGEFPVSDVPLIWRAWWLGDLLGALVFAPVLLVWAQSEHTKLSPRLIEAAAFTLTFVGVSYLVFITRLPGDFNPFREPYLLFPVLMWAALRFEQRGATIANLAVTVFAIVATTYGHGPFVEPKLGESFMLLHTFTAVASMTTLLLAAAISERKQALHARDEFLRIVSHDLRNPLGAVQVAATHALQVDPGTARLHLEVIERAAGRALKLVRDLLDIAAMNGGELSLTLDEENGVAIVRDAIAQAEPLARARGHQLVADIPPGSVPVIADGERVLQVLINLLDNAIKFTPEDGTITVRLERATSGARFVVRNTGASIPAEHLPHIFDVYWRGTRSGQGKGLGLAIAKHIVEAHGGELSAVSSESWTELSFTLPR